MHSLSSSKQMWMKMKDPHVGMQYNRWLNSFKATLPQVHVLRDKTILNQISQYHKFPVVQKQIVTVIQLVMLKIYF